MKIERLQNLEKGRFLEEFLVANKPVIVTDAMNTWQVEKFQPDYLREKFGNYDVQVYNDLFDLQAIDPLSDYLRDNFNKEESAVRSHHYIRWYTKLKDVDFFWSDEVFQLLRRAWQHPYFLPANSMAIPFTADGREAKINETSFPYKGLFISGKGSRTRLHRDPFNSNAILCQFYGEKKILLYDPSQAEYVMNNGQFIDIENPDSNKFPDFSKATCSYEDTLVPGEIVFFPGGWFHDVKCLSDSISITWNFVHSSGLDRFYDYINQHPDDDQLEIVRFFLKDWISPNADVKEITGFLKSKFHSKITETRHSGL
jgi:hypothetical protein